MFDFNKIKNFDDHIALSIPSYNGLINTIMSISEHFLDESRNVYDIGCSTGSFIKRLKKVKGVNYYGIDNSSLIPISCQDDVVYLRRDFFDVKMKNACLITSIFTAQFTHRERRDEFYQKIYDSLEIGGAFIIAEKTHCESGRIQEILNSSFYERKSKYFKAEDILKKELSLRQNLKTESYYKIEYRLREMGLVQEIWRSFNFVAFLVIKEG